MWLLFKKCISACNQRKQVLNRLSDYARMQEAREPAEQHEPEGLHLSGDQHAILLGILKKVEAKNASLLTMWSLMITSIVAFSALKFPKELSGELVWLLILAILFLFSCLVGMRQVDQVHYKQLSGRVDSAKRLQDELICDMLTKEAAFRFAHTGAFFYVGIAMLLFGCAFIS